MSSASAVLTSPSVARVRQVLVLAGLHSDIVELPGAARTAKAAADFLGVELERIANSLVFRGQETGHPVLVIACGAHRVDTQRLALLLGEPVDKADAQFVRRHTGFAIGGVAPVGHGISRVYVDIKLAGPADLWAAAGHPHTVLRLTYEQLLRLTGGRPAELAA